MWSQEEHVKLHTDSKRSSGLNQGPWLYEMAVLLVTTNMKLYPNVVDFTHKSYIIFPGFIDLLTV